MRVARSVPPYEHLYNFGSSCYDPVTSSASRHERLARAATSPTFPLESGIVALTGQGTSTGGASGAARHAKLTDIRTCARD